MTDAVSIANAEHYVWGDGCDEDIVSNAKTRKVYYKLVIVASSPTTEIWLGDDEGHLVQKEVGKLTSSLLPGRYVVE